MKVAILIKNIFSYGGTENIASFMSKCIADFHHVDVLSLEGSGETFYDFSDANNIESFQHRRFPLLSALLQIKKNKYDLIFIVGMGKLSVKFYFLSSFFNVKSHSKIVACEHVAIDSFNKYIKIIKIWALKHYNRVVVLTDNDKDYLLRNRVSVVKIPNSLKYNHFDRVTTHKSMLAIGRLVPQKNFLELVEIWADFKKNKPDWVLNIAGDGFQINQLKKLAKELKVENSINFLGKVKDVDRLYKDNDIFLMSSKYEGLPLVLLEAKSWSLPTIAYDCPTGPSDIIENEVDGYLVPMGDKNMFVSKLNYLASNNDILLKFANNTKITHMKFSEEKIKFMWLDLISRVADD